jgi:phage baseplate assembly protein V
MDPLREIKDRLAALERRATAGIRVGTVDKVDRTKCRARVKFPVPTRTDKQTGEVVRSLVSEELAVLVKQSVKNSDYWMPDIDEQVVCLFPPNCGGAGFVLGSFYSDEDPIPEGADAEGVRMVEFADGSSVEYNTETSVLRVLVGDLDAQFAADRLRVLVGDLETEFTADHVRAGGSSANQPFVRGTDLKTLLAALIDLVVAHVHPTGVGPSGPPANASAMTAKKADLDGTLSPIILGR